jgi:hypothetical protein
MGTVSFLPRMFRPKPVEGDDVSAVFAICCGALNRLKPKTRDMVARWIMERYAAQLEEDLERIDDLPDQSERDARYAKTIARET